MKFRDLLKNLYEFPIVENPELLDYDIEVSISSDCSVGGVDNLAEIDVDPKRQKIYLCAYHEEMNKYEPFDVVVYKPTGESGLVKRVTEDGVFVLFRIQSTAQLCKFEDLEKE